MDFTSDWYFKVENYEIEPWTLKEEVDFVSNQIQDQDLRDLYLYYYKQYIKPQAPIFNDEGLVWFAKWWPEYYDNDKTKALLDVVKDIISKTGGGEPSRKKAEKELRIILLKKEAERWNDETPDTYETYIGSEIETMISSETNYYFVRHPEMAYSVELWFNIRYWLWEVVYFHYDCPCLDINFVDGRINYYLEQPEYSHLKKKALIGAKKKQLNKDFEYDN